MMSATVTQKEGILQIMKFFQDNDKSNIIILDIVHRYDLPDNLHVNKDIKTFNSKLKKSQNYLNMLQFWNSDLLEIVLRNMISI